MDTREVGRQIWEPFARWVSRNHPEDVAVMYQDETQSLERHTREYAKELGQNPG